MRREVIVSEVRHLSASIAASERWIDKSPAERATATRPGRTAFQSRFTGEVDARWPHLDPAERARRVRHLERLYFSRLRLAQLREKRQPGQRRERVDIAELATGEWGASA